MIDLTHVLIYWKAILEIIILWIVIYQVMLFFEGTRAIQVVRGIALVLVAFFLFQKLGLERLDWLFRNFFATSVIALLIIFHPEIRQGLARLGRRNIFVNSMDEEELDQMLKEISKAVADLSGYKIGALIAIEKNDPLSGYVESGIRVDAKVSSELIQAIFTPNNPLHDGGMIIQRNRIVSAGALFPLAQRLDIDRIFGTRHRAALGLSEESDALIVVVSEERQDISLVYQGRLYNNLTHEDLFLKAKEIIKVRK
ncbi:MAG: diadenylate cyclase CdaA [Candidatus Omnitrophota bacterium]|nr:diadenylate cyclase CdaA [Candidatus Omnitrophota bacterium]